MTNRQLLRIGQLAQLAGVSPRTIDYYTKIKLISPEERSNTNYRLYSPHTVERLNRIETLKKAKYSLDEIKEMLDAFDKADLNADQLMSDKLQTLTLTMEQLEKELKELQPYIEQMKPNQVKNVFKVLTPQSIACIDAMMVIIGKGPFM